jgi:hypothetical protein
MPEDDLRTELIRAVATELTELGYRPSVRPCYLQREGDDPLRLVAEDVWRAVGQILAARDVSRSLLRGDEAGQAPN